MSILVNCSVRGDHVDLVAALLWDAGAIGILESERLGLLSAGFEDLVSAQAAIALVAPYAESEIAPVDESWVVEQRAGLRPSATGGFFVRAPWHDPSPDRSLIEIIIDPGAAFGHGAHPTTSLLLDRMAAIVEDGMSVVDVGTGTGVLAIAAARSGARVLAVDNDPIAVDVARRNVEANGCTASVRCVLGEGAPAVEEPWDLALANVTAGVHQRLAPGLSRAPILALSGLLESQVDRVAALYPAHTVESATAVDGWSALVLRRSTDGEGLSR